MKKPRSDYGIIRGVINKEITEEDFFVNISDSGNRIIIDQPVINSLKKKPELLRDFLLSLSVEGRFRIILTKEMLGMTQTSFSEKYGVSKDTLRILKGQLEKEESDFNGELREVIPKIRPPFELFAALAIMSRVPVQWLQHEKPILTTKWNINHFVSVAHVYLSSDSFIQYLEETREDAESNYDKYSHTRPSFPYFYDVRPIILHLDSIDIYLRVSIREQGDIIIELFGVKNQLNDFTVLEKILKPFYPLEIGYCKTVIDKHINLMILARSSSFEISYPIEFIKF